MTALTTLEVRLADAPRDVLVWLVDDGPQTVVQLAQRTPGDATEPHACTARAVHLLSELGWVEMDWDGSWRATEDGRRAVAKARDAVSS